MEGFHWPTLNASLNALAAVFLTLGFVFIKQKNIPRHKIAMGLAFLCSTIFLACYLYYHATHGSTRFEGVGAIRYVYFSILISHTILATVMTPFVLTLLWRAWKNQFEAHARLARWVWPVWMYVSVTGVVVYLMLYHL